MDRKKIIEIIIVVAAFSVSGLVLYNGLYSKPAPPSSNFSAGALPGALPGAAINSPAAQSSPASAGSGVNIGSILPYGSKLDFSPLSPTSTQPFRFDAIEFPVLNASSDVGILPQDLLK